MAVRSCNRGDWERTLQCTSGCSIWAKAVNTIAHRPTSSERFCKTRKSGNWITVVCIVGRFWNDIKCRGTQRATSTDCGWRFVLLVSTRPTWYSRRSRSAWTNQSARTIRLFNAATIETNQNRQTSTASSRLRSLLGGRYYHPIILSQYYNQP